MIILLPMLTVHEPAIDKELNTSHGDKDICDEDLNVGRVERHHRYVNADLPKDRHPFLVQFRYKLI